MFTLLLRFLSMVMPSSLKVVAIRQNFIVEHLLRDELGVFLRNVEDMPDGSMHATVESE